jgi:hypothetical protein
MTHKSKIQKTTQCFKVSTAVVLLTGIFIPLSEGFYNLPALAQSTEPNNHSILQKDQSVPLALNTDIRVNVETDLNSDNDPILYLDQLTECTPGAESQNFPFFIEDILMKAVVLGWEGEHCQVKNYAFYESVPEQTVEMSVCLYSQETLALMTDEVAYEEARTGEYSFDSSNERDAALATAMEAECDLNFEWFEELTNS